MSKAMRLPEACADDLSPILDLYNAGGSPKAAEKRFEGQPPLPRLHKKSHTDDLPADAAKLSNSVRSSLPGSAKATQKDGEVLVADAGKKIDDMTRDAKAGVSKIDSKLEGYRKEAERTIDSTLKETKKEANATIDKFDKTVEEVSCHHGWLRIGRAVGEFIG